MLLHRLSHTIQDPSGVKLEPAPPFPLQSRWLSKDLPAGTLTGWANEELTVTLSVNSAPAVTTDSGVNVVTLDGVDDRLGATTGPSWKSAAMLVKLPTTSTGEDMLFGPQTASNGQVVWNSSTGLVTWRNGTAAAVNVSAAPGWNVVTATIGAAGAATLSVNKLHAGGTIGTEMPPPGLRVGGHFSAGQHAAISILEINLSTSILTPSQIDLLRDYAHAAYPTLYTS